MSGGQNNTGSQKKVVTLITRKETMSTQTTIATDVLADILPILQKELAEVTIEPKMEYFLDFQSQTAKEYQTMLFALREAVWAALEEPTQTTDSSQTEGIPHVKEMQTVYSLVFYIITDPSSDCGERMYTIYDTPYFATKKECIKYILNEISGYTGGQLAQCTWELICRTRLEKSPVKDYKPDFIRQSCSKYWDVIEAIREWLATGLENPDNLGSKDSSDYEEHFKVSEPKYKIDAYVRFDNVEVCL